MPLASLAELADLPSAWEDHVDAQKALDVASAAIRDAAEGPIGEVDGTLSTISPGGVLLHLPGPVRDVTAVVLDGNPVTDYRNVISGLWRACGWGYEPAPVLVTGTFGLPEVPDDIVDMCVQLAVAWLQHRTDGGGSTAGLKSVKLDDAAESYTDEAAGQVSPVFIPEATRRWLAARFGGSGVVVVDTF